MHQAHGDDGGGVETEPRPAKHMKKSLYLAGVLLLFCPFGREAQARERVWSLQVAGASALLELPVAVHTQAHR